MKRNVIETIMGAVVLLVAAAFLVFAVNSSDVRGVQGYEVTARFNRIDGITTGSDVRMSGIKIGSVLGERLDPQTYLAELRLSISDSVQIPTDSTAKILADGLLGDTYLSIEPGADEATIEPGGQIQKTQDPLNLTDLIGRFMFNAKDEDAK
jgi:phospholipid/cholesterol/gamma-HCH transport system substrate-binding protein